MPSTPELLQAVILGLIEGLTEFLPVSSTAHLLIAEQVLGFKPPGEVFPIVIQFGAILSVVAVYWRKFWDVLIGLPTKPQARQFALGVIVAFLPAMVIGAAVHGFVKRVLFAPDIAPYVIATTLILGGALILMFERLAPPPRHLDGDRLPLWKCFQIGLCQCLAIIPGVSRSGATILGGELLGVERKAAAAFTFYLAVPTMLGATVFDLYKNRGVHHRGRRHRHRRRLRRVVPRRVRRREDLYRLHRQIRPEALRLVPHPRRRRDPRLHVAPLVRSARVELAEQSSIEGRFILAVLRFQPGSQIRALFRDGE